jgi:hypothetical protein
VVFILPNTNLVIKKINQEKRHFEYLISRVEIVDAPLQAIDKSLLLSS